MESLGYVCPDMIAVSVDLHRKKPWMLITLFEGLIIIWNYEAELITMSFDIEPGVICSKFMENKEWVISGCLSNIHIFDYLERKKIATFAAHADAISWLLVDPTETLILSAASDHLMKLWEAVGNDFFCKKVFSGHTDSVLQVARNPSTDLLASVSLDNTIKIWELKAGHLLLSWIPHENGVASVEYFTHHERDYVITGSHDCTVKVWEVGCIFKEVWMESLVQTLECTCPVYALCFQTLCQQIIAGTGNGTIHTWDITTYSHEQVICNGAVSQICSLSDSRRFSIAHGAGATMMNTNLAVSTVIGSSKNIWVKHHQVMSVSFKREGAGHEVQALQATPCWPCSRMNTSIKCGGCYISPHITSEKELHEFSAIVPWIVTMEHVQIELSKLKTLEERGAWIQKFLREKRIPSDNSELEKQQQTMLSRDLFLQNLSASGDDDDHHRLDTNRPSYVGLRNDDGITCYMNIFLQVLFHIPRVRELVHQLPTTKNGLIFWLKRLFNQLKHSGQAVETKQFRQAFGCSNSQEDAHEFNINLFKKLSEEAAAANNIYELFKGQYRSIIEWSGNESSTNEAFYDIQLKVEGCSSVYDSFNKYTAPEPLKYTTEHGPQDAMKRFIFIEPPPVLQLQLMRFSFPSEVGVKLNTKYEYPLTLNLDLDSTSSGSQGSKTLYSLHSVLVHTGNLIRGHYYVYIRPQLANKWYRFDDTNVEEVEESVALQGQFGGSEGSNAYILIYIKETAKEFLFCNTEKISKDLLEIPGPYCTCTGERVACKRTRDNSWESKCCTATVSRHPLNLKQGRRMSCSVYERILDEREAKTGETLKSRDLKEFWNKRGVKRRNKRRR